MQAIQTKYLPATNTRPSRIKAFCERGAAVVSYPHELSGEHVHAYAATHLCEKFAAEDAKKYGTPHMQNPWMRPKTVGCLPSGDYCHVFTS